MDDDLSYSWGFGNEHCSEAVPGALPIGRNSPQRVPLGLYAEQISATSFTTPRHENRRTWTYRVRPSATHPARHQVPSGSLRTAPCDEAPLEPNRIRWDPLPYPDAPTDFLAGLVTYGANGDACAHNGIAIHMYAATASMSRVFSNFDGELLVVPQEGTLIVATELGRLRVQPGDMAVIPRGIAMRVELPDGKARGYVCENYGRMFTLPELGPIGANGLANARDFRYPVAWFDEDALDEPTATVTKFGGGLWACEQDHSPFDVVAWHGSNAPYAYDLARFNAMNTVTYDHPDPSIYTVLTSPSEVPGTANADFVIFPPRWNVAEDTFRPPWFHRNVMSEFVGLVHGIYDAKAEGFRPGGASVHNCMSAHGPDAAAFERASTIALAPHKIDNALVIMFETRLPLRLTANAAMGSHRQSDYDGVWRSLRRQF